MDKLHIQNFGQIKSADITFGDLTVFVGPQATGKSIVLQTLKLIMDAGAVQEVMGKYGIDWHGKLPEFLDAYFGEGMSSLWRNNETTITWKNKAIDLGSIIGRRQRNKEENLFFIPAQRVLALRDGWPRPFADYRSGDPYAVREFSEKLRGMVERQSQEGVLFPQPRRLKEGFRDLLQQNLFSSFSLSIDKVQSQKRLVLGNGKQNGNLPFMVWSAGQREFVPLLLGLYWLMPRGKTSTRDKIKWVVIEELEMGLHSRAISVVLLLIFELIERGYRVCLSTHSPQVLDALWALRHLKETGADPEVLLGIYKAPITPSMKKLATQLLLSSVKIHYFDRESGVTRDISELDPSADTPEEAGWGGLSEFSGRANEAVANAVANTRG
ncbi:MAG: AAA family ATPase [Candidatus Methylacidiphilales bacterium]